MSSFFSPNIIQQTNVRGRNDDDTFYAKMGERKGGKSLEKGKNAMQNRAGLIIENHNQDSFEKPSSPMIIILSNG